MKKLLVAMAAGVLVLGACGSEPEPETADAYRRAYEQACEKFWANSPEGNYYGGISHTVDDCLEAMPDVDGSEFLDEGDASRRGEDEGYAAALEPPVGETICWGTDCSDDSEQ